MSRELCEVTASSPPLPNRLSSCPRPLGSHCHTHLSLAGLVSAPGQPVRVSQLLPQITPLLTIDSREQAGETPSYPKPSISLRPSRQVTPGGAVTIRCRGRHLTAQFLLYNVGNLNMLQDVEPAGDLAEFPICNIMGPARLSKPSDPVELVVAGECPCSQPHSLLDSQGILALKARLCPDMSTSAG
uniref:Uncharacterized protein n=1 Tax=Gopherus agassizii TaxID=38772 RepID=A0A452HVD0_9SAUR